MDLVMVEPGVARLHNNPGLVLRGLAELAHLRSLCTWGALLLAAVAALGSLVRALRKAVRRRIRLHGVRAAAATGCGAGRGMAAASVLPMPCTVGFSDRDDAEDLSIQRRCSFSCSDSGSGAEWNKGYEEKLKDHDSDGFPLGCCVDDDQDELDISRRHDQQQDSGFGVGGWDSWLNCGSVVKAWDQDRGHTSWGGGGGSGGPFRGFVPLIRSLCIEPPNLTLTCSDGLDLHLWDSRLRSCVPAAVIAGPAPALRRRAVTGFGAAGRGNDKAVYVAGRRGGGVLVDLRNTKEVLLRRADDGTEDEW